MKVLVQRVVQEEIEGELDFDRIVQTVSLLECDEDHTGEQVIDLAYQETDMSPKTNDDHLIHCIEDTCRIESEQLTTGQTNGADDA